MAWKLEIKNNYMFASEVGGTKILSGWAKEVKFYELSEGSVYTITGLNAELQQIPLGDLVDSDDNVFTRETLETFYTENTGGGFSSASGGIGTLQQVTDLGSVTTNLIAVNGLVSSNDISIVDQVSLDTFTIGLRDIVSFTNQPYFQSSLGYYNFKPLVSAVVPRLYLMPNGTPTGTTTKLELFNTDYESDTVNYNAFNIVTNNTQNEINIGANRGGTGSRLKMTIGGDYVGSSLESTSPKIEFKTDDGLALFSSDLEVDITTAVQINVPDANKKTWTTFEPLHLGNTTVFLGRNNASTSEFINNAYFDGSWKKIDDGFSHRFSMGNDGTFTLWTSPNGSADDAITWTKIFIVKEDGSINMPSISMFANDSLAGTGGLVAGDVYRTSTGELRIKL